MHSQGYGRYTLRPTVYKGYRAFEGYYLTFGHGCLTYGSHRVLLDLLVFLLSIILYRKHLLEGHAQAFGFIVQTLDRRS